MDGKREKLNEIITAILNAKAKGSFWLNAERRFPGTRQRLMMNKEFKDAYSSERCFVIGNGPSLNEEDLSVLEREYVFTVNQAARNPQFKSLKTNFHFWADKNFFDISEDKPEDMELLQQFIAVGDKENQPIVFLPYSQSGFVEKFRLDEKINIRYFASILSCDAKIRKIDFSKGTYGYSTVVHWAIAMAIYMGFKKIYLLGCDTTGIVSAVQSALGEQIGQYSYQISEREQKRMQKMYTTTRKNGIEEDFASWLRVLRTYKKLYDFCSEQGILLTNCSSRTIIDSIPRASLKDVLSGG